MKKITSIIAFFWVFIIGFSVQSCGQKNNAKTISTMENRSKTIQKTEEEWKKELSPEQYYVLRQSGTEKPYSGALLMNKDKGIYKCAGCGNELFTDEMKFDSHCGWPSFDKEIAGGKITTKTDNTLGMSRTEINCAKCGGHLGHIFDDGPTETGKRYCVNSVSLSFEPVKKTEEILENKMESLTLGGGCFWCIEAVYQKLDGVQSVTSGYAGGTTKNPSYREIGTGKTGHAEVTQLVFDNTKTSVEEILKVFFTVHNPTTLNKQGADVGTQYRSIILYHSEKQKEIATEIIDELNQAKVYDNPIVTEIKPFTVFYKAEEYHQNYYSQNQNQPYCQMVIQPKIEKFEKIFKDRIKK